MIFRLAGALAVAGMVGVTLAVAALDMPTPVPDSLLAGQDVLGPVVQAACMSGLLAAAAIEPTLLRRLGA